MTQNDRVLRYLRANPGCTTMELQLGLRPFVSNPRARISDLREQGHVIDCEKGRYRVREKPVQVAAGL